MISFIVSFDTALSYWSCAGQQMPQRYVKPLVAQTDLQSAHGKLKSGVTERVIRNSWLGGYSASVDLLVPLASDRHVSKQAKFHCWQRTLPAGALVPLESGHLRIGDELCEVVMSSPEFCFLQMAQVMDDYELIELGYELCGAYAINPAADHGLAERGAVTTPRRLSAFLENAEGAPGVKRARRALKWVLANSKSPKESQISILAVLPRKRGGFGLPSPLLNYEMPLRPHVARVVRASVVYPDLYWPQAGTVLEYDSRDRHDTYEAAEHDAAKRAVYQMLGLNVLTLTKRQFYDLVVVSGLLDQVAKHLQLRRTAATESFLAERGKLHQWLVRGKRRERQVVVLGGRTLPRVPREVMVEIPW